MPLVDATLVGEVGNVLVATVENGVTAGCACVFSCVATLGECRSSANRDLVILLLLHAKTYASVVRL